MNAEDKKKLRDALLVIGVATTIGCAVGLSIGMKIGNKSVRETAEALVDYSEHLGGSPANFYIWLTSQKK